jgi:cytochrome c oxidase cbb3-type subunit III
MKRAAMTFTGVLAAATGLSAQNTAPAQQAIPDTAMFMVMMLFICILLIVVIVLAGAIKSLTGKKSLLRQQTNKISITVLLMIFISGNASASSPTPIGEPLIPMTNELLWVLWSMIAVLVSVIIFLSYLLHKLLKEMVNPSVMEDKSILLKWEQKFTGAMPVELEADILLDHEYDGIRELDNNLPPWWKYGFYATIIFSFIYMINYHVSGKGDLQETEYQKEILAAELKKEEYMKLTADKVDENTAAYLEDIASLASGKSIYAMSCAACHGQAGEGGVGPNLADEYWIHGGDIKDVFRLIKFGNPQKGMIAWQSQLNPRQIQEVSSYILSLHGSNPANGKAPEGELYLIKNKSSEETGENQEAAIEIIN